MNYILINILVGVCLYSAGMFSGQKYYKKNIIEKGTLYIAEKFSKTTQKMVSKTQYQDQDEFLNEMDKQNKMNDEDDKIQ